MKQIIYILRHGQTDWNVEKRLQGRAEIHMNEHGRSQVRNNAAKLGAHIKHPADFDYISSPSLRTCETMQIVRSHLQLANDDFLLDNRLRELSYGQFEGFTWDELRNTRPLEVKRRFENSWDYPVPGGESYAGLSKRVLEWLGGIENNSIVTTHAGVMRCLQASFSAHPKQQIAFLDAPQDKVLILKEGDISWL